MVDANLQLPMRSAPAICRLVFSPIEASIIRFDDKQAAEAELVYVRSYAANANARLREVERCHAMSSYSARSPLTSRCWRSAAAAVTGMGRCVSIVCWLSMALMCRWDP